jgi:hypothetical protein
MAQSSIDSLIIALEKEISNNNIYTKNKLEKIGDLEEMLNDKNLNIQNQYFVISKIIEEYQYFSFEKALFYAEKNLLIAEEINEKYKIDESKLKLSRILVDSGRYKEALDFCASIATKNLENKWLNEYYFIHKEAYSGLNFYTMVKNSKSNYAQLYETYKDSLLNRLSDSSLEILALKEKKFRDNRELDKALDINNKRLQLSREGRDYSLITFERSLIYQLKNDIANQKKFLILSAISDIRSSIKDNASLTELAMILYSENDIERAHEFISFSMEDAKFYNSPLRFINISNVLPSITEAYENRINEQKNTLQRFVISISILSLILLVVIIFVFIQNKKITIARNNLNDANFKLSKLNSDLNLSNDNLSNLYHLLSKSNDIKEHYIAMFLNLYSEYIDKLDIYRKSVTKFIITNKTNELLELARSKSVIESELKLFYKNFDESFLHIYPNFINQFNDLLREEERIILNSTDEQLNTELRIYALIRLGITNSSKIAKILRYSVNTIYNYRVKIKNSAINREDFEDLVKKIE